MRIGIDIDDTISNTWEHIEPYMLTYFYKTKKDINKKGTNYQTLLNITYEQYLDFAQKYYNNLMPEVTLKEKVQLVLNKLKEDGHTITIITARECEIYKDPYQLTIDWLTKNNIPFDKLIVNAKDKGLLCQQEQIDIFVDDSIVHCNRVSSLNIKTLLFNSENNQDNYTLRRVNNWEEIYKIINEEGV